MNRVRVALLGLGTVNLGLLKILSAKSPALAEKYRLEFIISAVSDSSGLAVSDQGFDYQELLDLKSAKQKVRHLSGYIAGIPTDNISLKADASILVESSPVNLQTGNPGLSAAKDALSRGWNVVFANKAPLVFAFAELHDLAIKNNSKLAYSATVCGGLPVINVLQRDLHGAKTKSFRGILNATTNHILKALESGGTMEQAIQEAQRVGAAEADPMHDVLGHDAANKLLIIMKSFINYPGGIDDIMVQGIQNLTAEALGEARQRGNAIKLIASAVPFHDSWQLSVKPTEVSSDSFLGQCEGWEMGVEIESDFYENISMKIFEEDPIATSAAVYRDMLNMYI